MGLVASQFVAGHGTDGAIVRPLKAIKGEPWGARARIPGWGGVNLTESDVTARNCTVKRMNNGTVTETYNAAMAASVIKDTLVTDNTWDEDDTGYNFIFLVPASAFPANDHYQVEFSFTTSAGTIRLIYAGPAVSSFAA